MRVTMLLCDAAQVAEGKLFVLGGGWSLAGPDPVPSAIALKLEVPWDQTSRRHRWQLSLVDADGQAVTMGGEGGGQPVVIGGDFEVGRPPGLPAGASLDVPIAINLPPLPLRPGSRYEWRLSVDDQEQADWALAFTIRPRP
ncbi:MAG: hypothetical protein LC792_18490 [Actinobacteria bacterium]|nr:hypothetical protein [Actinomycetota bacterium]